MKNTFKVFGIIALVLVIGFSMMGCVSSTTGNFKEPISGVTYNIAIPAKNIQIIGLVRVETKVDIDNNGELITYDALLKASEAVGGNGIANIMIDRLQQSTRAAIPMKTTTWYGSALAIKFTNDNLPADTPMSTSTGNIIISGQPAASRGLFQ